MQLSCCPSSNIYASLISLPVRGNQPDINDYAYREHTERDSVNSTRDSVNSTRDSVNSTRDSMNPGRDSVNSTSSNVTVNITGSTNEEGSAIYEWQAVMSKDYNNSPSTSKDHPASSDRKIISKTHGNGRRPLSEQVTYHTYHPNDVGYPGGDAAWNGCGGYASNVTRL